MCDNEVTSYALPHSDSLSVDSGVTTSDKLQPLVASTDTQAAPPSASAAHIACDASVTSSLTGVCVSTDSAHNSLASGGELHVLPSICRLRSGSLSTVLPSIGRLRSGSLSAVVPPGGSGANLTASSASASSISSRPGAVIGSKRGYRVNDLIRNDPPNNNTEVTQVRSSTSKRFISGNIDVAIDVKTNDIDGAANNNSDEDQVLDLSVTGRGRQCRPRSATDSWLTSRRPRLIKNSINNTHNIKNFNNSPSNSSFATITSSDKNPIGGRMGSLQPPKKRCLNTLYESEMATSIICEQKSTNATSQLETSIVDQQDAAKQVTTSIAEDVDMAPSILPPLSSCPAEKEQWLFLQRARADSHSSSLCVRRELAAVKSSTTTAAVISAQQHQELQEKLQNDRKCDDPWRKCPAHKLIADTPFVVDAFSYGDIRPANVLAFFLTHFHYEHYRGLSAHTAHEPIYCSHTTGRLLVSQLAVSTDRVRCLSLNEPRVINNVQVTLLDANHCPGAVMILFKLTSGVNLLHVGDFRADPSMESYPELWNCCIDRLYLDTTYCDVSQDFASQSDVVQMCAKLAVDAVNRNARTLIVCGSYMIGKERVFMSLAEAVNSLCWVSQDKLRLLACMANQRLNSLLTTDQQRARVHVLPLAHITVRTLSSYLQIFRSQYTHLVAFKPTSRDGTSTKLTVANNVSIYGVPYSEHSSYSELRRFVQFVAPRVVVACGGARPRHQVDATIAGWLAESGKLRPQNSQSQSCQNSQG